MKRAIFVMATLAAAGAQTVDRTKPPETPPVPNYKLPPVYETKLANGMQVMMVDDQRFPLMTVRLAFFAGSKYDPADTPGLAETVAALLKQGTTTRSYQQIAEELDGIGGSVTGVSSADAVTIAGVGLAEFAPKLLELVADIARNANFPEKEVQLHVQNRKQELMVERSTPDFLAREKMASIVYGGTPYARVAPTVEALDKIDPKTLTGYRDTYLIPNNAALILVGKLPARPAAMKLLEAQFGSWKGKASPALPAMKFPQSKREIVLVDRPGSVQADIMIGRLAVDRNDPEYFPANVGNIILGGGMTSRMFANIREKQGFAYDAHSELEAKRVRGKFNAVTQVRNEVLEAALKAVLGELETMANERVKADELTTAKNFLSGIFLIRLETQSGLAEQLNAVKTMGLPVSYLEMYTARVRSVEPDKIQEVAKKYMSPEDATIVVVGDASKIQAALEKFGKVTVSKAN